MAAGGAVSASGTKGTGKPDVIADGEAPARIRALIPVGIIVRIRGFMPGPTIATIPATIAR